MNNKNENKMVATNNVEDLQAKRSEMISKLRSKVEKMTLEELKAEEEKLVKEIDEVNTKTMSMEFTLPEEHYEKAAEGIRMLLEEIEVPWQFAKGMQEIYNFWDPDVRPKTVVYGLLDVTLRQLGQLKFKGISQWNAVIDINTYFEPIRNEYVAASESMYEYADKHNVIMDRIDYLEGKEQIGKPLSNGSQDVPTKA